MTTAITLDTTGMSPKAADRFISVSKRWDHMKATAEKAEEKVISSAEAFLTGLGIGYIEGRYPDKAEVIGFPLAGVVGLGAHIADLLIPTEKYGDHLANIGNAGFAIYGRDLGAEFGQKKAKEAQNAPRSLPSSAPASTAVPAGFQRLAA